MSEQPYALAIHGGAGVILRERLSEDMEAEYRAKLLDSVEAGEAVLKAGGTSIDATIAAIRVMEDSELFNAGKGAVFTHEGRNEMDAAVMDGKTMDAGAVAGVTRIRNPIEAAKRVMTHTGHVLLMGEGAEEFAEEQGVELVDPSYFHTEKRWEQLQKAIAMGAETSLDHSDNKFGTVGAVALDSRGNLAAATSTGGMTNKRWRRIGDTPVIGAGTYAQNATAAISTTGHGEYMMRYTVARDVCALMEFKGLDLQAAAREVIHERFGKAGGEGGLIAVDAHGNIALELNTPGMYRGSVKAGGAIKIEIFR